MSPEATTPHPVNPDEQLLYESRVRNRQVVVAAIAGVFVLVASVVSFLGATSSVSEATLQLIYIHKRFPLDLVASVINGFASVAAAWTLVFLYDCARARNPKASRWIRYIPMVGGGLAAISGIAYQAIEAVNAHKFVTTGHQTYGEASHLAGGAGVLSLQLLALVSSLLLALGFVLVSLHALRVGLLSRFLGYLGMFAGALVLFPLLQVPVVQAYWLLALAYLLSGRWPTGVPAAWRTGRAEALPSSAELRARRAAGAGEPRGGRSGPSPSPAPAGASPEAASTGGGARPADAPRTRATTSKRKRKRRN